MTETETEFGRDDPEQYTQLLDALQLSDATPLRGILVLAEGQSDENRGEPQLTDCQTTLLLAQALAGRTDQIPRLYLVTHGAQQLDRQDDAPDPSQAALWGLGRVIAAEMPRLNCTRIDLDPHDSDPASRLFGEIWVPDQETEIALRGTQRFSSRLVPRSIADQDALSVPRHAYRLGLKKYGVLDNLILREVERQDPREGQLEIAVEAAGLNFRDVLRAWECCSSLKRRSGSAANRM